MLEIGAFFRSLNFLRRCAFSPRGWGGASLVSPSPPSPGVSRVPRGGLARRGRVRSTGCAAAVRAGALRRPGGAGIAGVPELASRGSTAPRTFFQTLINETSRSSGRRRRTGRQARRSRRSWKKERGLRGAPEPRRAAHPPAVGAARPPLAFRFPPLPGPPRPGRTEPLHTAARGASPSWDGGSQPPPGAREATCVLEANFCLPR